MTLTQFTMAKDPAFLFYSQDFLVGTMTMSFEDRGKYIMLLCFMHQNGPISDETIRLLVGSASVMLMDKFTKDENGFWHNERLKIEVEKRNKFTESRKLNGLKGGRPANNQVVKNKKLNKTGRLLVAKAKNNLPENENDITSTTIQEENIGVDFQKIFDRWLTYKKAKHQAYKDDDSKQTALKKLIEFSESNLSTAEKIIDTAIGNNWAGFFKIKEDAVTRKGKFVA